jgi:hypothetical protein
MRISMKVGEHTFFKVVYKVMGHRIVVAILKQFEKKWNRISYKCNIISITENTCMTPQDVRKLIPVSKLTRTQLWENS